MIESNWICLELLKTRGWESRDRDDDILDTGKRFLAWARKQGLLEGAEARRLRTLLGEDPAWWRDLRGAVQDLRALLHDIFVPVAENRLPADEDLASLENVLSAARQRRVIGRTPSGDIAWTWEQTDESLADVPNVHIGPALNARVLGRIARSAADLLTSGSLERVKVCDAHDCGWFFVDVSRNRSRRWCDMAGCGNRVKARRYRERHA